MGCVMRYAQNSFPSLCTPSLDGLVALSPRAPFLSPRSLPYFFCYQPPPNRTGAVGDSLRRGRLAFDGGPVCDGLQLTQLYKSKPQEAVKARREERSITSTMMRTVTTSVTATRALRATPGSMNKGGAPKRKLSAETTMVVQ